MNASREASQGKREAMNDFVHAVEHIDGHDTARFGGKATGLARMAAAGIPVPPAFVIGTDGYRAFRAGGGLPKDMVAQTERALAELEAKTGRRFANDAATDAAVPLLVSVRSGAQVSMPGMMDTVLNLGITCGGAARLARETGNAAFAVDTWVRFWRMFAEIVLGLDGDVVVTAAQPHLDAARADPTAQCFAAIEAAVLAAIAEEGATDVRADPRWQLQRAIAAVFESWDSRRARAYRAHHGIADDLGTAVTVQAMVFGNFDARSGSGVAFTRNPNTGAAKLYGEFLTGRQGEDLVAGTATPTSLDAPGGLSDAHRRELAEHGARLEEMYGDAVDIEFTVEGERLYFLQVRAAKRTAEAAVRIAAELVEEGLIGRSAALQKVSVEQFKKLLRPAFEPAALAQARMLVQGIGASPGHSYGIAVLDADRAATVAASGERVILMRPTTSPQDIRGMLASQAIVTARGGALSHAAVVSRALDVPCVVGCEALEIDLAARSFRVGDVLLQEGAPLSVDGATGKVYSGLLPLEPASRGAEHIERLLGWADESSQATFWVAGVSGADARNALRHAPQGFGVIALTDLLIAAGTLDQLIDAINDLGQQPDRKTTQDRLTCLTYEACRRLLLEAAGTPVDLRLPNLGSPRAQRMIGAWASLAPRLFLPLGLKGLYVPLLRGIADAARETGHAQLTPLVPGINGRAELEAFRAAAAALGIAQVGAVLQSPAAIADAAAIAPAASALWVDVREIIRTYYGYPSALSFGDDVFESYVNDGYLSHNPRTALGPNLGQALRQMASTTGQLPNLRLGAACGDGAALSLVEDLYRAGLRSFSVPTAGLAAVRLALGQLAIKAAIKET
jgi:pyruvate,orthophosphate dikinase